MQSKVQEQRAPQARRTMFLREQLKVLQHELGEDGADGDSEIDEYRQRIAKALQLPEEVRGQAH